MTENQYRPHLRIEAIKKKLEKDEGWNAFTLAREFKVNRKTIVRDIEFMRKKLEMKIRWDVKLNSYYLE